MVLGILRRFKLTRNKSVVEPWEEAQDFEWQHSVAFMETDFFKDVVDACTELCDTKRGKVLLGEVYMKEFFNNESGRWQGFADWIDGRTCLEIGPNVAGVVCAWWWAGKRIVIEPLIDQIRDYQKTHFHRSLYTDDVICHSLPAEILIPDLVGSVDGAIICRNCIDHSPEWMFILNNISTYAVPGSFLLFWSDLYHNDHNHAGHYNITRDVEGFRRLLNNLGFDFLYEFSDEERDTINFGCLARKR